MKKALITGVSGQDGQLLTELLLSKDYKVVGLISKGRISRLNANVFSHKNFQIKEVNYESSVDFENILQSFAPNEIYNLVAASSVKFSFENPFETAQITAMVPIRILESLRKVSKVEQIRFYQASSSEMFGNGTLEKKSEDSQFKPASPYAVSKLFAHQACQMYRDAYGMFVSCGILFNHESSLRSEQFVSRKISMEVARIAVGQKKKMTLGALHPRRDWGFAGDYVDAMWRMLQQERPDDFVIATGRAHSVFELASLALKAAGLEGDPMKYIETDTSLTRPLEINGTYGDASKAREVLNWVPTVQFDELVKNMVLHDIDLVSRNN